MIHRGLMPLIIDGGGEALGQANLPVNTPGARGLQSLRTRRPPRHQPGWSAQRWEENIVVLGYNRPEANLVGVFQNGCFTPAILSKTYTRFVHFYEKFRLEEVRVGQRRERGKPPRLRRRGDKE